MLCHNLFKYLKLVKTSYVLVLGGVEDEKCFSSLNILKFRVHDKLDPSPHGCEDVLTTILHVG